MLERHGYPRIVAADREFTDSRYRTLENVLERARRGRGRWGAANPARPARFHSKAAWVTLTEITHTTPLGSPPAQRITINR
jgi:hypothetical protein